MTNLFSHRSKTDPALKRYPQALAELITFGELDEDKDLDYAGWARELGDYVPDLIRMVLDDDLNEREDGDPALWAPVHAFAVLCELGPLEAAEPLTACFDWEDDWIDRHIPDLYAAIGPASIPVLHTYLLDPSHLAGARAVASGSLAAIAGKHEAARSEIVALLAAFLDRPEADASADEETITTMVIDDLADLGDPAAYDAIRRAYAQDRVSPQIISLQDVETEFGMRPPVDHSKAGGPRREPGVHLDLRCKVCGRERGYVFNKVYYDLGTGDDETKRAKYNPVIIPERVVCSKCGAVDQYELSAMGHVAVTASMMAEKLPSGRTLLRKDQRVQFITFSTQWGPMHPQEAIERYERELARRPADPALWVGLGNVQRFLGHLDEAEAHYQRALNGNPRYADAWISLAQVAGERRDIPEAMRCWQRVKELAPDAPHPQAERLALMEEATGNLAELRRGRIPEYVPNVSLTGSGVPAPAAAPAGQRTSAPPKIGRNDPCPCGSGKKYKHCHGRAQ